MIPSSNARKKNWTNKTPGSAFYLSSGSRKKVYIELTTRNVRVKYIMLGSMYF